MTLSQKQVLHVGCGEYAPGKLHPAFEANGWGEIRLDIDPDVRPDLVGTITDMPAVADGSVDAVFSAHNLEHLYAHEVPEALQEFRRVLNDTGFALITLPDLQEVSRMVADGKLNEPAYISPMGPVRPLDILFGFSPAIAKGNCYMAHRTGFIGKTLSEALIAAGFAHVTVQRNPFTLCLWAIAFKTMPSAEQVAEAERQMLPLYAMLLPAIGESVPA